MMVSQAKGYIGARCEIISTDRKGIENRTIADIYDVTYIPMYGACLVTDVGEILLDRVRLIVPEEAAAA